MNPLRIAGEASALFPEFKRLYESSFPLAERRGPKAQAEAFANPRYRLEAWMEDGRFAALMGWWAFDGLRYIEHVAVAPASRSRGVGSRVLRAWLGRSELPALLEIEQVADETTRRRRDFYLRLGFAENPMDHVQPPYQGGGAGIAMRILSHPAPISPAEYARFAGLLKSEVWASLGGDAPETQGTNA